MELYNDDCNNVFSKIECKIDLILTDPPYNISKVNNFNTMRKARTGVDFGSWDYGADIYSWITPASKLLKAGGSMIIFSSYLNMGDICKVCEENNLVVKDLIRWIKPNPMPRNINRRYVSDYEFAIWVVKKGKWTFNRLDEKYQRPCFCYPTPSGKTRIHTTQKPVGLMEDLIMIHSNKNDVVLDCFMGSGSTGVACLNTERIFIGVERDIEYYNKAKERLFSYANKINAK